MGAQKGQEGRDGQDSGNLMTRMTGEGVTGMRPFRGDHYKERLKSSARRLGREPSQKGHGDGLAKERIFLQTDQTNPKRRKRRTRFCAGGSTCGVRPREITVSLRLATNSTPITETAGNKRSNRLGCGEHEKDPTPSVGETPPQFKLEN